MPTYTIQVPGGQTVRIPARDFDSAMREAAGFARGATGYLTTAARAFPFLSETGAAWGAGIRSLDDLRSGRTPDLAANWAGARGEQQATVDSFRRAHPFLSNNATALGTVAPMAVGGLPLGRAPLLPAAAARIEAAGSGAATKRAVGSALRNAFTGAGVGAVYGAAQPGSARQRAQYAADALGPGAIWGAGVPLGAGAAAAFARNVAELAPGAGAIGSELVDTLRRAATGRTPVDQSRQIPLAAGARGEAEAVNLLRQMGVSPEALEQRQAVAGGKPITTAEAIGPEGMGLARGLRGRAGTTDALANSVLGARSDSRPDRILMDAHQATEVHPLSILGDLGQLQADSRERGESYMEDARALAPPFSARLKELFEAPQSRARYQNLMDILGAQGQDPVDLGYRVGDDGQTQRWMVPSLDFLDTLKEQLQGALEGQTDPLNEKQQEIRKLADGLHASMTSAVPSGMAYAKAHEFRGDLSSIEAAWRNAQGRLLDPAIGPARFSDEFDSLRPFEKDTATAAGVGDIANLAYARPFNADAVSDADTFQKMRSLFGTPVAQRLRDALTAEGSMADFEQPPAAGLPGLGLRLRAAGQAPLNMAGRNALGNLLYQDPTTTAQTMRGYGAAPNAFDAMRLRLPPFLQYAPAGVAGALQAPNAGTTPSQPQG